jgi:GNAT superfamily N-acetyltransferase
MAAEFNATAEYRDLPATLDHLGELFHALTGIGLEDAVPALGTILVAEVDGRVVGMICLALVPHLLTGQLYVDEVAWWVDPAHRGGTAGPRLLKAAEQWAVQNHANLIRMVAPCGSDAGRYYRRCGYKEVETTFSKALTWPDSPLPLPSSG